MIREVVKIAIDGEVQDDLVLQIAEIEVEEHVDAADVFRVRLSLAVRADGTWSHLDDARFSIWNRIAIHAGYAADHALLIDGYITHVSVALSGTGGDESYLELTGMDASVAMDLEDKQVAWINKKDSDIAQEIFAGHGLAWEVEDTLLQHGERVATILQSESDIRFLRRLAARNGFECYVKGGKGFFRSPNLQEPPQKVLALQFGAETNVTSARFEVDGTPATRLEIRRVDPFEKREEREALGELPRRQLARRALPALRPGAREGRRLLKQQPSIAATEMQGRLRAGYHGADTFVTASGEIDGRSYGAVLRAKRLVALKGAGATHSGLYYVTRVRHHLTPDAYAQSFDACRNAVGVLGTEPFAAPQGPIPLTLSAGDTGSSGRNRELPAQHGGPRTPGGS
jgi:phage protein D